ncbi:MAG: ComEA family DNA-binding protein [Ignavibacteriaceae bacterium]
MRIKRLKAILLLIFSFSFNINGQIDSTGYNFEDVIDDYVKETSDQNDPNPSIDYFENLINNPIDLNTAGISDIQSIPYMDLYTAEIIIKQRESYGPFFSKAELYFIKGIPSDLIDKILPFINVELKDQTNKKFNVQKYIPIPKTRTLKLNFKSRIIEDLQPRRGFIENKFAGSPYHISNKLRLSYGNHYQAGLLEEKDAGETSLTDFTSFHLEIKNFNVLDYLIIGDYQIQFGYGLAVSRGYGLSKGAEAILPGAKKKFSSVPYSGSNENNFFRGLTGSISIKGFNFTGFISKNRFDAKVDSFNNSILSVPLDGLHRTTDELSSVDKSSETLLGFSTSYSYHDIATLGILFYNSNFEYPFNPSSIYHKSGSTFNYYSLFYNFYFENVSLSGESAFDSKSISSFVTIQIAADRDFIFVTSLRNYPYDYINLHGSGFGERAGYTNNEFGFYSGFKWRTPVGTINFYYDQFRFPYATADNPLPSNGNEFLFDFASRLSKQIDIRFRIRREKKEISQNNLNLKYSVTGLKYLSKFELVFQLTNQFKLRGIFSYNNFNLPGANHLEDGFLVSQEINYNPLRRLNLITRLSFFNAASINTAIYEYENDMAGFLSGNIYTGEGSRWYFICRYEIYNYLNLSIKYSETFKPNVKSLSSGYSMIYGNLDNRFGLQIEFKL